MKTNRKTGVLATYYTNFYYLIYFVGVNNNLLIISIYHTSSMPPNHLQNDHRKMIHCPKTSRRIILKWNCPIYSINHAQNIFYRTYVILYTLVHVSFDRELTWSINSRHILIQSFCLHFWIRRIVQWFGG